MQFSLLKTMKGLTVLLNQSNMCGTWGCKWESFHTLLFKLSNCKPFLPQSFSHTVVSCCTDIDLMCALADTCNLLSTPHQINCDLEDTLYSYTLFFFIIYFCGSHSEYYIVYLLNQVHARL